MAPPPQTAADVQGTFRRISETERGERARRASAGALVLWALERVRADEADMEFALRRAEAEVDAVTDGAERSLLRRLLLHPHSGEGDARLAVLAAGYACALERTHRLPEADAAIAFARSLAPADATAALHAGRIARKLGERERALALYREASDLDGAGGAVARMARVGEAVVSPDPERALARAARVARRAGDAEAAAVAHEERAALRRSAGDRLGAARDLCLAAVRYADPVDRSRVAHALAGLALTAGDPAAAREALLVALAWGDAGQRDHARARLHTLSRDVSDEVGMRRWRSFKRPSIVSLSAYRPRPGVGPVAPRLARWRQALERREGVEA